MKWYNHGNVISSQPGKEAMKEQPCPARGLQDADQVRLCQDPPLLIVG